MALLGKRSGGRLRAAPLWTLPGGVVSLWKTPEPVALQSQCTARRKHCGFSDFGAAHSDHRVTPVRAGNGFAEVLDPRAARFRHRPEAHTVQIAVDQPQ
jgi:hypothetical protein